MTTRRVVLEGGAPWGFRMHGGKDQNQLLRISRVNPGCKAASRGIREGDLITSINGRSTKDLTNVEAHNLLKQTGEILILGLNEESGESPKRRQYKTIHQETHEETVKKSSITTSYSLKKTVETVNSQTGNKTENGPSQNNEHPNVNGTSKSSSIPTHAVVSQKPSLTSGTSTSPSSTLVKEADQKYSSFDNAEASERSSYTNCTLSPLSSLLSEDGNSVLDDSMNEQGTSKSKRRRQRRKNRKTHGNNNQNVEIVCDNVDVIDDDAEPDKYLVHSPTELAKSRKASKPVKSKSLDDDDDESFKIQELSETSETEDKENQAIISEAESDVEWEETLQLATPGPLLGALSTITLPLEGYSTDQVTLISPEEEKNLRDFLEGLNLVNGPEEAAKKVYEKSSLENIKERKAKRKAALDQYFLPFYQNPRYLDVISEETSDRDSDKEQPTVTHYLKQGTPEQDQAPEIPPRPTRERKRHFPPPFQQPDAILVDTKIVDNTIVTEGICSTRQTEEASNVEVVYLKDSSGSNSPEEGEDSTSLDSQTVESDKSDESNRTSKTEVVSDETNSEHNDATEQISNDNEKLTATPLTDYDPSGKSDTVSGDPIIQNGLLSQLTPPPTPENISPKSETFAADFNIVHTNVISPLNRSLSPSSSRSSSRSSSLSTAKYVPSNSSFTDVQGLKDEEELTAKASSYFQPLTLREICLKFLITLPFGKEILQELAELSKYIGSYTDSLPNTVLPMLIPNLAKFVNKSQSHLNNISSSSSPVLNMPKQVVEGEFNIPIKREDSRSSDLKKKEPDWLSRGLNPGVQEKEVLKKTKELDGIMKSSHIPVERNVTVRKEWVDEHVTTDTKSDTVKNILPDDKIGSEEVNIPITKEFKDPVPPVRKDPPKEVIIPVKKEWKETPNEKISNSTKLLNKKEVTIPIRKEWNEDEKSRSSVTTKEHKDVPSPIRKEVFIPVVKAWTQKELSKNSHKEVKIPVKKEWNDKPKEQSTHISHNAVPKEVIIPISIPVKKEWNDTPKEQSTHISHNAAPKEVIIPIKREVEDNAKNTNEKIIPITKEWETSRPKGNVLEKSRNVPKQTSDWFGLQSESNPSLLACLSPKQKEHLEKTKKIPEEAEKLIELHEKFINRTSQEEKKTTVDDKVTITGFNKSIVHASPSNRLLTIIKEDTSVGNNNSKDFLYFVEKEPKFRTLPRSLSTDNPRLRAKDLGEWLQLARNKSMSESNLSSAPEIPENNLRDAFNPPLPVLMERRTDFYEQQMLDIREKEREIERQLEALEDEKRKLYADNAPAGRQFYAEDYYFSKNGDFAVSKKRPTSMPAMPTEFFRQQMFQEYMDKFAEMEDRKQHKVIKVTSTKDTQEQKLAPKEIIHPILLEDEFLDKVKKKQQEGKLEKVTSLEKENSTENTKSEDEPVLVMDGDRLKEANTLPKHLQEFVDITKQATDGGVGGDGWKNNVYQKTHSKDAKRVHRALKKTRLNAKVSLLHEIDSSLVLAKGFLFQRGIWSPGQHQDTSSKREEQRAGGRNENESIPPIWMPKSSSSSPTGHRKEFKPVNYKSPVLSRKTRTRSENLVIDSPPADFTLKSPDYSTDTGVGSSFFEKRLTSSQSSPASGFGDYFLSSPRLPKAQNPTITLLQKAREGQLPRGPTYIEQESKYFKPKDNRPPIAGPGEVLYQIKNEYTSESDSEKPRRMADLGPRKFEGIGPVTKDGMPLILRSEVKDQNQSKWYKRMYDTIHKTKPHTVIAPGLTSQSLGEFVTVRYRQKRAQYPYTSGYLSEPEPGAYDSDFTEYKYQTLDRRRQPIQDYSTSTMPRSMTTRTSSSDILREPRDYYKPPGRIENYTPGNSSISDKEAKQWWDEVMDIFDGHLEQQKRIPGTHPKSFINQALKESGYESDSTLVFRKREDAAHQLSPKDQKEAYKVIQKGGDVPLQGLRKPAPERPKEPEIVEFFPISPTLTRIRVHKSIKPQKEIICYPVTVHHDNTFSTYKRSAPSLVSLSNITSPPKTLNLRPPSPPRRKSSRNNPTLRLVSTMKVKSEKSPLCKRHETCFATTSTIEKSKVNYLKDKISYKLSPTSSKRSSSPKMTIVKKITASPDLKNRITSSITTTRDPKTLSKKIQSRTNIHSGIARSKSTDSVRNLSRPSSVTRKSPINVSDESLHRSRKFGSDRIAKSPDLLSPTEVKKAIQSTNKPLYRRTNAVLSSSRNSKTKELLPIRVGITERAKNVLKLSPKLIKRISPSPSTTSEKSRGTKSSLESLSSPKLTKKNPKVSSIGKTRTKVEKNTQKSKKEQINGEIVKKDKNHTKTKEKSKKCVGKAEGASIAKQLKTAETTLKDIKQRKEAIESNHFFQNLFLRDISPAPLSPVKNSWIVERTNQLIRRRSSFSEPSIGAMKVYLKHTRPVSDSKFISLDMASVRSRSASPKSVTFDTKTETTTAPKRSSSLPPKLIFSQTSRPVSPVVQHRRPPSPPPSPKLSRSPSSRKIMHFRDKRPQELSLYMCPSLNHSTTSLNSLKSDDYQRYFREYICAPTRGDKFKDLNQFYSGIEKVGELERACSLKPRKKSEYEIIDFDRWREVRTRERAEQELGYLYRQLKESEKEKGFLFLPHDPTKYRWRREFDRGLRIKEKSVDDIKEEFERIKMEESERENSKRRELAYLKDTYKPLWRGSSVANMATSMIERRSQSEGRIKPEKHYFIDRDSEKLLNYGIGSRIWSSLSMEQVNILKEQLAAIYNGDFKKPADFSIKVPPDSRKTYVPTLSVRRNSDSSKQMFKAPPEMTEDDKKVISQSLSKELLEKLAKYRKESRIVVGKEILGAVAAVDAKITPPAVKSEHQLPKKPLVKTDDVNNGKINSTSETESGSTDESTKTVIHVDKVEDVKKKVEYFEKVKDIEAFTPTIYKPAEETDSNLPSPKDETTEDEQKIFQSKSCQNIKEYFGERELVKFATIPLSATRKQKFSPRKPDLRATDISPIRSEISITTSNDSLNKSRSSSPYPFVKTGEVNRLKHKFEWLEDVYGNRTLKRSRSESDISKIYPGVSTGFVDNLRKIYEYPAHSGRGRSRMRRGGVVSPIFLRAEDRLMPHINIISKIASLYGRKSTKDIQTRRSMEELAEILGCPVGEVEKLREKFDSSQDDISLVGHMYTSSPSIRELRDIAPYLTANWTAHRFPRYEDNTRSLSSPESSIISRDTSLVRREAKRPKSTSPIPKAPKSQSILKPSQPQTKQKGRVADFFRNQKYDPKMHEPVARYQPTEVARYKNGWSVCPKPTVSFKEPDPSPPVPPPKGMHFKNLDPESPRKYVENEVTIHYKTPVRQEIKEYLSEDELAYRQGEAMKKIYQEERRKKYLQVSKSLQELQDMNSRRHTDNFIPSQKSPISLNRYDNFDDLTPATKPILRSPEPRLVARALYNFVGQTSRELTFRKGDLIYVRRQVDKNWYEGELNAMVGLFPTNYVEIVPYDGIKSTTRKSHEGQARAKYNFLAQTHLELSLAKGELVVITRRVDNNWFEGKIGGRKGIFPASYVEVLIDPQEPPPAQPTKPVASPAAHSLLLNGSAGGKESMGSHSYTPNIPSQITSSYQPAKSLNNGANSSYSSLQRKTTPPMDQALHIETQSDPVPYRALYKYTPQNDDELELLEGDTVFVLEKCDDGWYVGSSDRTGAFGTFPGNYVEKI